MGAAQEGYRATLDCPCMLRPGRAGTRCAGPPPLALGGFLQLQVLLRSGEVALQHQKRPRFENASTAAAGAGCTAAGAVGGSTASRALLIQPPQ